jgi:hypothetical protein
MHKFGGFAQQPPNPRPSCREGKSGSLVILRLRQPRPDGDEGKLQLQYTTLPFLLFRPLAIDSFMFSSPKDQRGVIECSWTRHDSCSFQRMQAMGEAVSVTMARL